VQNIRYEHPTAKTTQRTNINPMNIEPTPLPFENERAMYLNFWEIVLATYFEVKKNNRANLIGSDRA
jgi:hypothetical protein